MQRKRDGLGPIGDAVSGLDDELVFGDPQSLTTGAVLFHRCRSSGPVGDGQRSGPRSRLHGAAAGAV